MEAIDPKLLIAVGVGLLMVWFLIATGLGRLLVLFVFTAAMALAMEGLVYVGLTIVMPNVMRSGLAHGLSAWAFLPPLLVAAMVTFYAWREGV